MNARQQNPPETPPGHAPDDTTTSGAPATAPGGGRTRRRGAELHAALLQAAWDEIATAGYANVTMESVAKRARTGVAVLYRRWANKDELILAAFGHYRDTHPVAAPDTGSLRGDLIALLEGFGQQRTSFFAVALGCAFSGLLASTGLTIDQFRDRILGPSRTANLRTVYQRAHDRGEIDVNKVPSTVLALPTDMVRHDLLMNPAPVSSERIKSILDDAFLPLVLPATSTAPSGDESTEGF